MGFVRDQSDDGVVQWSENNVGKLISTIVDNRRRFRERRVHGQTEKDRLIKQYPNIFSFQGVAFYTRP